ncbi:hypothetical protein CPB83DRAFT_848424 [Crepidotus variabilis]|uniref:Uncharacterized protein n=1 Tax=Crepidotus variabilis TaxID=179855 RepID=A0A9P6EM02_9AGAR|nr:hypothetical protein CPB83DRAFT_848424 [Crepidotus variabilis]
MKSFFLTFLLSSFYSLAHAGSLAMGQPCNPGNNRLQTGTFQFWSDCNSVTFCSDQGICENKGCRSDDFPFGYPKNSGDLPPKCPKGQFCPDEGSECQDILPVGSPCQLNRDDQCEGPPNYVELTDTSGRGLNNNGSVCLNNVCMWANATAGMSCTVENTPYIVYGSQGEFIDIVSRGNCKLGQYCDSVTRVCIQNIQLNGACSADKECDSMNCMSSGKCGVAAATPTHFRVWVYILVGVGIIGGMSGVLFGLYLTHRKQREIERAKRARYWQEQNAFHQNLLKMREAARASVLSLPQQNRELPEDLLQYSDEPKAPGLQNFYDTSDLDFNSKIPPSKSKMNPGRF